MAFSNLEFFCNVRGSLFIGPINVATNNSQVATLNTPIVLKFMS